MTTLTAHDCFTTANDLFARGHYLDAQTLYDRACRLDPNNAAYAEAQRRLQVLAFAFFRKGHRPIVNASDAGECCCEGLGEGCYEGLCSNCDCDGCDCDCS